MVKAIEVISGWEKLHALIARSNIYAPEEVNNVEEARIRERYWKSHAGRKKLKQYFNKIINTPRSSSG